MLNARKSIDRFEPGPPTTGEVVRFPLAAGTGSRRFGRARQPDPFSLVVDLANEDMGWRWCRGAATLAMLCGSALLLSPGFEPFTPAAEARVVEAGAPLNPAAPDSGLMPPPAAEPARPRGVETGTRGGLRRVTGEIRDGLYWSLREAGASPELAAAYLKALAPHADVGEIAPFDRFDFITDSGGQRLVYAALDRFQGDDVELARFESGGKTGWFSAASLQPSSAEGLMAPVAGRISSRFGSRTHPILRFTRFHSGVDFAARWGSPIAAAADGHVIAAGHNGGYGRQVQVAHGGGVVTSYSHMSQIAAAPGTRVRQGQLLGYVGSSGLSTGPHLHFEVRVGGRAIDPLSARLVQRPALDGRELARFKARLKELKAIPTSPVSGPGADGVQANS